MTAELEVLEGGKVAERDGLEHQNGDAPAPAPTPVVVAAAVAEVVPGRLDIGECASGDEAVERLRKLGRKKVAIVGFAPSSYHLAPFQDSEWEVWTLNEAYTLPYLTRADRWFEIHVRDEIDITQRDPNHIKWLREQRALPIYMTRHFDDIPMSVAFPIKDFIVDFATDYWTNTISYMIALAVAEGFETIGIWGVDMAQGSLRGGPSEYGEQRPSCEYFVGYARGLGHERAKHGGSDITVYIPPQSDLLKSIGLYGYDGDGSRFKAKIRARIEELQGRINGNRQQCQVLERNIWGATGAIQEIGRIFPPDSFDVAGRDRVGGELQKLQNTIGAWQNQLAGLMQMTHQLEGAADDCLYWLRNWVPLVAIESEVERELAQGGQAVTQ